MPHLLIAGTTGSGKSVFINNLIAGLVCKNTAKEMRFVFIDPKMVELAAYKHLPHLACPVISDVKTQAKVVTSLITDRKSTRLNSSHGYISYAVFCLKKKKQNNNYT